LAQVKKTAGKIAVSSLARPFCDTLIRARRDASKRAIPYICFQQIEKSSLFINRHVAEGLAQLLQ
jgi:hypothetical protein